ncbi:N,N-dimethylformamidase beta subunit family domain-containing protein [Bordetella petrii]|uniref:N,N-dimethylformamidase beta subunit family domain-containing protein n=1 Tax=Bordetella petrii TaxID=94624 RepID=UPI00372F265B
MMEYVPSIVGYVTPLSGRPGDTLEFKISSRAGLSFEARVVRIDCCDPNPAGPGMKLAPVAMGVEGRYPGKEQPVYPGSCAWGSVPSLRGATALRVRLAVQPTLDSDATQVLWCLQDAAGRQGIWLGLRHGRLACGVLADGRAVGGEAPDGPRLPGRRYTVVTATWDVAAGRVRVHLADTRRGARAADRDTTFEVPEAPLAAALDTLCVAATWHGHPAHCCNGLFEGPELALARGDGPLEVAAHWHFGDAMTEQHVPDRFNPGHSLALVNVPVRAVRSSAWTGLVMDWKAAPEQYAAIHFHDDDLSDCGWQTSVSLRIPADAESAVYGLEVRSAEGADTIPFFVQPGRAAPRRKILYLASTLTYLAYANHARGNFEGALAERVAAWGAYPHNPDRVTLYGKSTYNRHSDGSGISLSSRLRPILTMRPGYLTFADPRGSGLRHFVADSHLTDWLRVHGHAFDVITDEDLDEQGVEALRGYDLVITGSHPEYHTRRMLDAILAYREGGGNFMYMGANGFYWKIARHAALPHVMEIRRAEGGIRAWASEPGEYYNQLDGEYGGMWRRNGRAPQVVGGVGFAVQGNFEGSYYVRTEEAAHPDVAWVLDGVDEAHIGDYGLSGGGAAGFELDQRAFDLGSDENLRVIAVSQGHGPSFKTVPEEILTWTMAAGLPRPHEGICAHMVCGTTAGGGGLFASGSITFLGSLFHNQYENGVSRILQNCVRRYTRCAVSS